MSNPLRKLYRTAPKVLKKRIVSFSSCFPLEFIYGREYKRWNAWLKESDTWSEERIETFQIKKLKETFSMAYAETPYYHRLFDDCGFAPDEFRYLDQMKKIPFLTKQLIQDNIDRMVNSNLNKESILYYTTSGSTGIPMGMYKNNSDKVKEAAFVNYIWKETGYRYDARIAVLRGAYYGDRGLCVKEGNRLLISTYDMTEENLPTIYHSIVRFRPKFLHVYPSAVNILGEYMLKNRLEPIPSIQCIYTASENLYSYQRETIEKAFRCKVFDFYGHTEHACMAKQVLEGYVTLWQYGFTELRYEEPVDPSEESKINNMAEIVATTYDNTAMPLIRYRTMDLVANPENIGGRISFKDIEGRKQDFILTASGRKISIAAINMHDEIFDHVQQFQFYQDDMKKCVLRIVRRSEYGEDDEIKIRKKIGDKLGSDIYLELLYVNEIPRTKSGKYKFMDQRLPMQF